MKSSRFNVYQVNERIIEIQTNEKYNSNGWENLISYLSQNLKGSYSSMIAYRLSLAIYDLSLKKEELTGILENFTTEVGIKNGEFKSVVFELAVSFEEPYCLDIDEICQKSSLKKWQVIQLFISSEYTLAYYGFTPGFCYLDGLPSLLHFPRKEKPRLSVPAGSIAIAGNRAGIYPGNSAGGWWVLGHTDYIIFDPNRDPAFPIRPGDRIRFIQI